MYPSTEYKTFTYSKNTNKVDKPGARPTKHISIEFEIRWKFKTLV